MKTKNRLKINLTKFVTAVCVVALLFSLTACGSESGKTTESTSGTNEPSKESMANTQTTNGENRENDTLFEEIAVVDNEECAIKITGIDIDNIWGYTIKASFENKSADKTYMYSVESASINGVQCGPFFAAEVVAGKKSNNEISFPDSVLEDNGIGDYTDIELTFRVHDNDDWKADAVATETVHVYPYGEDKASNFVREPKETDNVILDNEYVTVIVTGYEEDTLWGYAVNLFFLNKTDKNIMFSVDEASINGYMADPFYATEVKAGKCAFGSMSWSDETLEDNGISSVEEIEFNLRVHDSDDWRADDLANEPIILKP